MGPYFHLVWFFFCLKDFLCISYNDYLPVINSFRFCMSENVYFIFLKYTFFNSYIILGWQFFSFQYLKDAILLSSDLHILYKKYSAIFIFIFMSCVFFSFCVLFRFSLYHCFGEIWLNYYVLWSVFFLFFVFLVLGICWSFLICGLIVFMKFGNISAIISSNHFLPPPLSCPVGTAITRTY